jgi:hypothetical protein
VPPSWIDKLIHTAAVATVIYIVVYPSEYARAQEQQADSATQPVAQTRQLLWDRTRLRAELARREASARRAVQSAENRVPIRRVDPAAKASLEQAQASLTQAQQASELERRKADTSLEKAAYLGVATSPASAVLRKQLKLPEGVGLVIDFVEPASPAHDAGLEQFDIALRLDEQILINPQQLAVLVRTFKPGAEIKLELLREGMPTRVAVKLVEREVKPLDQVMFGVADADNEPAGLSPPVSSVSSNGLNLGDALRVASDGLEASGRKNVPARTHNLSSRRPIRENDTVMMVLKDVEGPGVATVKQARIGPSGELILPRIEKPVPALGCTPVELRQTVEGLYRSIGMTSGGLVEFYVSEPPATQSDGENRQGAE